MPQEPKDLSLRKLLPFAMFLIMGFSIWPVMIKAFVFLQIKIGNMEHPLIKFLQAHDLGFVIGIWCFLLVGLCIALPEAVKDLSVD